MVLDFEANAKLKPTSCFVNIKQADRKWKRKQNRKEIGLHDLVQGFLFALQADGRAPRTHKYYPKLLKHLLSYATDQGWPDRTDLIDTIKFRQFLSWVNYIHKYSKDGKLS